MQFMNSSAQTNWKFIAIVAIVTLLLGGGVWWYGKMLTGADSKQEQKYLGESTGEIETSAPSQMLKTLELLIPENLQLCMGDEYVIRWKNTGLSVLAGVILRITPLGGATYVIESNSVLANQNEEGKLGEGLYVWNVGKVAGSIVLNEGVYKIHISDAENQSISDESETFRLIQCQG